MSASAAAVPLRRDPNLVGIGLFIASESLFFLGVVVAYVVFREPGLALARAQLDVGRTAVFSVLLFASSGTVGLAAARRSRAWIAVTIVLGAAFLAGQGLEYARLLGSGLRPGTALVGTTFFTLTGLHALHVLVGLALLSTLLVIVSSGRSRAGRSAWEGIALYWHFVDAVWVVVFSVVYLGTLVG